MIRKNSFGESLDGDKRMAKKQGRSKQKVSKAQREARIKAAEERAEEIAAEEDAQKKAEEIKEEEAILSSEDADKPVDTTIEKLTEELLK